MGKGQGKMKAEEMRCCSAVMFEEWVIGLVYLNDFGDGHLQMRCLAIF